MVKQSNATSRSRNNSFRSVFAQVSLCTIGTLMMLFGLSGGFHPLHNVLHFVSGAAIIGFLCFRPTQLVQYLVGFGFFYALIGTIGTAHHQTIDATFLHTPFHLGHVLIGLFAFVLPGVLIRVANVPINRTYLATLKR